MSVIAEPFRTKPIDQRGGIISMIVMRERETTVDDIFAVFGTKLSRNVIRRRLVELVEADILQREWRWDQYAPRYTLSEDYEKNVKWLLENIIKDAGQEGISESNAMKALIEAVYLDGDCIA